MNLTMNRLVLVALAIGLLATAPGSLSGGIPPIESRHADHPMPAWVSAADVLDEAGRLSRSAFDPRDRRVAFETLDRQMSRLSPTERAEPCAIRLERISWQPLYPRPLGTLEEIVRNSPAWYQGEVLEQDVGFFYGILGTLLRLEIVASHDAAQGEPGSVNEIYVFVQVARLVTEGVEVCKGIGEPVPEVGKRLLVFSGAPASQTGEERLLTPVSNELFFELPDGQAALPLHMRQELGELHELQFDELLRRVVQVLNEVAKGRDSSSPVS